MAKSTKKAVKPKVTGVGWLDIFYRHYVVATWFLQIIIGLTALFNSQYFVVLPNTIVNLSYLGMDTLFVWCINFNYRSSNLYGSSMGTCCSRNSGCTSSTN